MNDKYVFVLTDGNRYAGTIDEVRRILIDEGHYTYSYVDALLSKANVDHTPAKVEWQPGRNRNYTVNGVRMGRKCALFALEWKRMTTEEAECVLHANKLCVEVEDTIKMIRDTCQRIDALCLPSRS